MARTKVSFQGERGAFSEEACRQLLGDNLSFLPKERFEEVFRSLQSGECDCAVVPIENTLAGSVHENYDHLLNYELPIVAEANVRIIHNLIAIFVDMERSTTPKSRTPKVHYVTQAGVAPPTFVFFTNRRGKFHFGFERFLKNQLRRAFDFEGTPLVIKSKAKQR